MNINIFYHLLCANDGYDRFYRTYNKIIKSGLIDKINTLYLNMTGNTKWFFFDLLEKEPLHKVSPRICVNSNNESETLNFLLDYCLYNDGFSLYLHSKGVVRIFRPNVCKDCIQDWVDCMEYFLIEEHEEAIEILKNHYTCGVNLKTAHYSGNFWWARNDHIRQLKPCKNQYLYCEKKFLRSKGPKHKNLHTTKVQWPEWLSTRYPRSEYTDKPHVI